MTDAEEYLKRATDRDRKARPPEKSEAQQKREAERKRQDEATHAAVQRIR